MNSHQQYSGTSPSREAQEVTASQIQSQVGQWIKNVKTLLENDKLSQAVKHWSGDPRDKSFVDSGISSAGDSCPSLANLASQNSNLSEHGALLLTSEMLKSVASSDGSLLDFRLPLLSHPYWKKLCKRIRKFEKRMADQPNQTLPTSVNLSATSTNEVRKAVNRIPLRTSPFPCEQKPKIVEPKPKHIDPKPKVVEPKQKTIELKPKIVEPKPKPIEYKPKIVEPKPKPVAMKFKLESTTSESHMISSNENSEQPLKNRVQDSKSKCHTPVYEIESVRMLSTQSTQTPRSRTSSSSSKRERRLKFRARIRVLPSKRSFTKRMNGIRSSSPKENQSISHSASTANSKREQKISTSPHSRDRCLSGHQIRTTGGRERPKRRHHKSKTRELSQKHSRRSLHSQNSRTGSTGADIPKTSKTVCLISSKTKLTGTSIHLQKSTDALNPTRGSPSLKIRSARYRSLISTPKVRNLSSRKRSKPAVATHRSGECSPFKQKGSHISVKNDWREKGKSQRSASKRRRSSSRHKNRKHMLRASQAFVDPTPGTPPPTPAEKSEAEINMVKMKVLSILQGHQNYQDWHGNKLPHTYESLLSGPTVATDLESLLSHELKGESQATIREVLRTLLQNKETLYLDEGSNKENSYEKINGISEEIIPRNENAKHVESIDPIVNESPASNKLSRRSIDLISIASNASLPKNEETQLIMAPPNSINQSLSDVWAAETRKMTDEESLKNEAVYNHRNVEESAIGDESCPQSVYSDCFRTPLTETPTGSVEEKSSYSDVMSSSSGEIPLERLRAAEIYLDRYLSKCTKDYPPVIESTVEGRETSRGGHSTEKLTEKLTTAFLQRGARSQPPGHRTSAAASTTRSPATSHRRSSAMSPAMPERRFRLPTPSPPLPTAPTARSRVASPTPPLQSGAFGSRDPSLKMHNRQTPTERPGSRTLPGSAHKSRRNYSADGRDTKNTMGPYNRSRASPTRMPQERGRERDFLYGSRAAYSPSCERKRPFVLPRTNSQTRGRPETRQGPRYQPSRRNTSAFSTDRRKPISFRETPPWSRGRERTRDHEGCHVSRPHQRQQPSDSSRGGGHHSSAWEHSSDRGGKRKEGSLSGTFRNSARSTRAGHRSDSHRSLANQRHPASEREHRAHASHASKTPLDTIHQWTPNKISKYRSHNPQHFKDWERNIHSASSYYDPKLCYDTCLVHSSHHVSHTNSRDTWRSSQDENNLRMRGSSKPELHSSKWASFAREYYSGKPPIDVGYDDFKARSFHR